MFNWFKRSPQPKEAFLTYPQHYDETTRRAGGDKCELALVHVEAEGPFLNLVYQWADSLSEQEADNLDTRARAYVACAIYDAAKMAGLSCESGPPHGQRPSWLFGGGRTPISLVNAGFDVSDRTCFMQVGPGMIAMAARQEGEHLVKLAAGFQAQFSRIIV
jgi:hypothetical protein